MAQGASNAQELVRCDRRTDATSADEHSAIRAAFAHRASNVRREVGVVVTRFELERATVEDFMARGANRGDDGLLQRESTVISTDSDDHE
jgi:hypothetical protein